MKQYTYCDLEDYIYKVWQTADDIDTLFKYHGDAEKQMTEDEVANALLGLKSLHDMRCWQLMDMLRRVFELDQYCTDPQKLAARQLAVGDIEAYLNPEVLVKKKGKKK
jgi:hypothetical protein